MNLAKHSPFIWPTNFSVVPFKLGLVIGKALVCILFFFTVATKSLENFVSRSCMMISGFFSARFALLSMKYCVCSHTHFELGCNVDGVTLTTRVSIHKKTRRYSSWIPFAVTLFTEKKSHAHRVSLWRARKFVQVSEVRSGSMPFSFRM